MKITDLKPAPYNPRSMTDDSMNGLDASIATFGDLSGIVFNKRSGFLVTGHQRLQVLQDKHGGKLKIEKGKIVCPGGDAFPIRVVDWDEQKEKAANVTANNPFITGHYNEQELETIISELNDSDLEFDLEQLRMLDLLPAEQVTAKPKPAASDNTVVQCAYQVIIPCKDEKEQLKIHKVLTKQGYPCEVSTIQINAE